MGQVRPPPGAEALRRLVAGNLRLVAGERHWDDPVQVPLGPPREGRLALAERRATLVGAVYERRTRHVRFLDAGDEG